MTDIRAIHFRIAEKNGEVKSLPFSSSYSVMDDRSETTIGTLKERTAAYEEWFLTHQQIYKNGKNSNGNT
jgi:hypothetical protein